VFAQIVVATTDPDAAALAARLERARAGWPVADGSRVIVLGAGRGRLASLTGGPDHVAIAPRGYALRPSHEVRSVGVGYVDSAPGRAALDLARELAWRLEADVHAVHVVPVSNWTDADSGAGWRAVAAARRMEEIPGVHGSAHEGRVRPALAAWARDMDLLVIGARRRSALERLAGRDLGVRLARGLACPLVIASRSGQRQLREPSL
jgi:nucleotide-binding universal stress UspA family protein